MTGEGKGVQVRFGSPVRGDDDALGTPKADSVDRPDYSSLQNGSCQGGERRFPFPSHDCVDGLVPSEHFIMENRPVNAAQDGEEVRIRFLRCPEHVQGRGKAVRQGRDAQDPGAAVGDAFPEERETVRRRRGEVQVEDPDSDSHRRQGRRDGRQPQGGNLRLPVEKRIDEKDVHGRVLFFCGGFESLGLRSALRSVSLFPRCYDAVRRQGSSREGRNERFKE